MTIQRLCVSVSFCGNIRRGLTISGTNLTHNIVSRHHILMVFRYKQEQEQFSGFKFSQFPFFWWDRTRVKYTNPARSLFSLSTPLFTGDEGKKSEKLERTSESFLPPSFFSGESLFWETLFAPLQTRTAVVLQAAVSLHLIPFSRFFYSSLFGKRRNRTAVENFSKKWAITMSNFFFSRSRFAAAVAKTIFKLAPSLYFPFFSRPENS